MSKHHSLLANLAVPVIALAFVLFAPAPSVAQGFPDSDTREIASYVLSEPALTKYAEATENLGTLAEDMSSSCDSDESLQSLDDFVARIDATPGARAAIESAGMSAREYVVFLMSLFQNGMAAWAVSQPGGQLPPGVSMANVDFVREHESALQAIGNQTQGSDCNDDEYEDDYEDEYEEEEESY